MGASYLLQLAGWPSLHMSSRNNWRHNISTLVWVFFIHVFWAGRPILCMPAAMYSDTLPTVAPALGESFFIFIFHLPFLLDLRRLACTVVPVHHLLLRTHSSRCFVLEHCALPSLRSPAPHRCHNKANLELETPYARVGACAINKGKTDTSAAQHLVRTARMCEDANRQNSSK